MNEILLRNLHLNDKNCFYDWIKDKNVIKYSLSIFQSIKTEDDIDNWFQETLNNNNDYQKAIIYNDTMVGYAGISSISKINNSGEFYIFIGDKQAWRFGIGTYVTKTFVKCGFEKLNLNRISLTVSDENIYALKAYKNSGFTEEGRMRQACFRDNKYHDKILMSILANEYYELRNNKNST